MIASMHIQEISILWKERINRNCDFDCWHYIDISNYNAANILDSIYNRVFDHISVYKNF